MKCQHGEVRLEQQREEQSLSSLSAPRRKAVPLPLRLLLELLIALLSSWSLASNRDTVHCFLYTQMPAVVLLLFAHARIGLD